MSDTVIVAVIAGTVALAVAYVNSFLAESYRRFRDGSALAASIAGELAAYEAAWPMIKEMLGHLSSVASRNERPRTYLRPFDKPKDYIYEGSVDKLGLLGVSAAGDVVYVYSNINAFRAAMDVIARYESEMSGDELRARCLGCEAALDRAVDRGAGLIKALQSRSTAGFVPEWPWAAWAALLLKTVP